MRILPQREQQVTWIPLLSARKATSKAVGGYVTGSTCNPLREKEHTKHYPNKVSKVRVRRRSFPGSYREETAVATSADGMRKSSILCDSGANAHMISWLCDPTAAYATSLVCTFGNNGQLRPSTIGDLSLKTSSQEPSGSVIIVHKDVLYVPGLPFRLLSTEIIIATVENAWDLESGEGSHMRAAKKPEVELVEKNSPMT